MNTVSISFSKTKIFNAFDILAARCGYLLGDKVLLAGDAGYGVYAEEIFTSKSTVTSKVRYLIEHLKTHPQENLTADNLTQFLKDWQVLQNRKHKNKQEILLIKQMEKGIDATYSEVIKHYLDAFERTGMSQLSHLIEQGINLAPIEESNHEKEPDKENDNKNVKLSTVLLDRFEAENMNDVYLTVREFDDFITEQKLVAAPLAGALNPQAHLLSVPLFKLPALMQLKATELQVIRKNLTDANQPFKQAINDWSKNLRSIGFHPSVFPVIQQQFNKNIAPLIAPVQNAIDADEHLTQAHRAHNNTFELTITLHVCAVNVYWQYLTWCHILGVETLAVMAKIPDYEKKAAGTCLILQCAHRNVEQKTIEEKQEEQPVLTKRKTLEID